MHDANDFWASIPGVPFRKVVGIQTMQCILQCVKLRTHAEEVWVLILACSNMKEYKVGKRVLFTKLMGP